MKNGCFILILGCLIISNLQAGINQADSITQLINTSRNEIEKAGLLLARSKSSAPDQTEKLLADALEAYSIYLKNKHPEGQVDALLQVAGIFSRQNKYQAALDTSMSALRLAMENNYLTGQAYAYSSIGRNYTQMGRYQEAELNLFQSLSLLTQTGNEKETADLRNRIGVLYFRSGKFQQALAQYDTAIEVANRYGLDLALSYIYMNKANALTELAIYDQALEYHFKGAEIKEKLNDTKGLMQSYHNIGNLYSQISKIEEALLYYRKALNVAIQLRLVTSLGNLYSNMAVTLARLDRNDSVPYYYDKSIGSFEATGDKAGLAMAFNNFGNYLLEQRQLNESEDYLMRALELRRQLVNVNHLANTLINLGNLMIEKKNNKIAEDYFNEALELVKDQNGLVKGDVLFELSELYQSTGNYKKAYDFLKQYASLKDTIINADEIGRLQKIVGDYELGRKDAELKLAQKDKELKELTVARQKNQMIYLLIAILLIFVAGAVSFGAYRHKKDSAAQLLDRNKKIETLIQELHHRVKNNLQIVSGLLALQSQKTEPGSARQVIDEGRLRLDAIAMIHQKLYNNDRYTLVDLKAYFDNLTSLISESYGWTKENITTKVSLSNPVVDIDFALPLALLVNELVTNAFKHAVVKHPSDLRIKVELKEKDHRMAELSVSDNGEKTTDQSEKQEKNSFGTTLIQTLVRQLDGNFARYQSNGTVCSISFKLAIAAE